MTTIFDTTEAREVRLECGTDVAPGCGSIVIVRVADDGRAYVTSEWEWRAGPGLTNWIEQDCEDVVRLDTGSLLLQCPALNAVSEERCKATHEITPEMVSAGFMVEVPTLWLAAVEDGE